MGTEAKLNRRKIQEDVTTALAQSLVLLLKAARTPAIGLTVAVTFRDSESEVSLHTATLASDAEVAASHSASLAAAMTTKPADAPKEEVPS